MIVFHLGAIFNSLLAVQWIRSRTRQPQPNRHEVSADTDPDRQSADADDHHQPAPEPPMPTLSDFCHSYAPEPEHDIRLLVTRTEVVTAAGKRRTTARLRDRAPSRAVAAEARRHPAPGWQGEPTLADELDACGGEDGRCLSPACPPCARAYRIWLCGEGLKLLAPDSERPAALRHAGHADAAHRQGQAARARRRSRHSHAEAAARASPPAPPGAGRRLDLGLEIDRLNGTPAAWQPHFHLITSGYGDDELRRPLKPHYPATELVPRPMRIDQVKDRARQLTYCCKNFFRRYVRELDEDGEPTRNRYPLNDAEWREVLRFLDRHSFNELTILKGVRRHGGELRFTNDAVAEKRGEKVDRCQGIADRSQGSARW